MVYVISIDGNQLMPCSNVIARLLLKEKRAKCIRKTPFTIKLNYITKEYKQKLTLGVDTGSKIIGAAVVNECNEVIYISEVEVRNDITKKMRKRSSYRNNRRSRKTRYRKPRWANRKSSIKKDRFSPTMTSKLNSHMKEINFIKSILPISKIILETGNFDVHALANPSVITDKNLYRKGINYGYANTKSYVLSRDKHICQNCKGRSKEKRLEVHHIVYRSKGGSDRAENLVTLCKVCHDKVHDNTIKLKGGKLKGNLLHATQMNSIRKQLLKRLPEAEETFGYITKEHRQLMGLPKSHFVDAVVIASGGNDVSFTNDKILIKKCIPKGDYQQTKGVRSQQRIPNNKIMGFLKFDKVKYFGKTYFIKGRRTAGTATLMDIYGKTVSFNDAPIGFKTPKLNNLTRISGRSSWIIQENLAKVKCQELGDSSGYLKGIAVSSP